jgi:hypothetical protein
MNIKNVSLAIALLGLVSSLKAQWTNVGTPTTSIYTSYNVGIGTASLPTYQFPLSLGQGFGNTKIALYDDGTAANAYGMGIQNHQFRFHLGSATAKFSFLDGPAGNEIFYISGSGATVSSGVANFVVNLKPAMLFRISGNVSTNNISNLNIGVASANGALSAASIASDVVVQASGSSSSASINLILSNSNNGGSIKFTTKNDNFPALTDAVKMEIKTDGKVVIGLPTDFTAATPYPAGYNLFVSKGILAEKFKCAIATGANWSDHVFAKDYKLASIGEMESYIKANQHLPGIPSAEEMVKNGLDVATMDAKLLEKIEELSLYVIELKKENERILKKVEALEKNK